MKLIKAVIPILLLGIFLLPSSTQFIHEFGHHHEDECHDEATHICADTHGCDLCEFTYSAFVQTADKLDFGVNQKIHELPTSKTKPKEVYAHFSFFLRGPPRIS